MNRARPVICVAAAATVICGGAVALMGYTFSSAVEPDETSALTAAFWVALGMMATCGFWLTPFALGSSAASFMFRLIAFLLLIPTALLFGSLLPHQLLGLIRGAVPSAGALFVGSFALAASAFI
jgi:hypothetical protein